MLSLCILNIVSFKGLVRFNFLLFSFKFFVIILTITWLMRTHFDTQNFSALTSSLNPSNWKAILAAVASGGVAFAFTGFKHGVELAGESQKSSRTVPIAIIGSVICCLLLYLGLQIAFIGALEPTLINSGWQHLSFSGDVGPFVGIAGLLGLGLLVKLLYMDAIISPLGAGFVYITSTSRIIYAMSKQGYLPALFSKLNQEHFPIYAIAFNFAVGLFLFLPLPGWQAMVSFLVSAVVISYAMGPIALLCLRLQLPSEKRPFRLPAANIICIFAFYCCNLISYWTGWDTISKLSIAMSIGLLLLGFAYARNSINRMKLGLKGLLWLAPYLSGLASISYFGSFGGKGLIPFGWDFLVIALFSLVIMKLALISRASNIQEQFSSFKLLEATY